MTDIAQRAQGQWPRIIRTLLGEDFLTNKHRSCPVTGEGDDRYRFSDHEGKGRYFCACSDGSGSGFDLICCAKGCDFATAAKMVEEIIGKGDMPPKENFDWIARELIRSKRSAYLESRGLEVPSGIRFAKALFCPIDKGKHPAMVGKLGNAYHVTYLSNGQKAFDNPRRIFGTPSGAIELYPAAEEMGVSEGIESAIGAHMLRGLPVHAAGNTSLMKKWRPPAIAQIIHIYADWDENLAGHAAAYALAHRLLGQGFGVIVEFPSEPGDFADQLLRERRA